MADTTPLSDAAREVLERLHATEDAVSDALGSGLEDLEMGGDWAVIRQVIAALTADPGRDLRPDERAELAFLGGAAAEADGSEDAAHQLFEAALHADPGHQAALLSVGNLLYRRGDLAQAERSYRTLLARHRDDMDPSTRAEAYFRLARIAIDEAGDQDKALRTVEKALSSRPEHRAARRLLIDLHRADGNWEKVASHERRLLDFDEDADARFTALLELGDTVRLRLDDPDLAEEHYRQAHALSPSDPAPLERLVALNLEEGRSEAVIRDLAALGALTSQGRPARAASYLHLARIYRDELRDADTATACYNQSLDLDPSVLDGFEECNELLVTVEDWSGVEQHHRRMLGRLGKEGSVDVRVALWRNLIEVYQARLADEERALVAAEAVCDLLPRDAESFAAAEALMKGREESDAPRLRRFHRQFLANEPGRVQSIRALRRVELRAERVDAAWLLCGRLAAAGDINPDEEAYLENLRGSALPRPERAVTDDLWARHLRHPAVDPTLERLLAAASPALYGLYGEELKTFGVKRKNLIDRDAPLLFARVLADLSASLGLPHPPDGYHLPADRGVRVVPTSPPSLLVGQDMLSGRTFREIGFEVARQLALFRPGFLITVFVPEATLPWLVRCVVGASVPSVKPPPAPASELVYAALASELDERVQVELEDAAIALGPDIADGSLDLAAYLEGVRHTCDRVGLLLCEDIAMAAECVANDRRSDLLAWSISEDHLALRTALGIAYGLVEQES